MFDALIDGEIVTMESEAFFAWLLSQCDIVVCGEDTDAE